MSAVTAFAPATVANVSCGFDILGFAVNQLGDTVTVDFSDKPGINITNISGDNGKLPYDAEKNVCAVAIQAMLNKLGQKENISISLKKGLPLGSGLGSSAASSVAAVVAANELLGNHFSKRDLLPFAIEGERIACGSAHADNVAPCLLGGIIAIRDYQSLDLISLPVPKDLFVTLIHPHFELNTSDSRSVLKKNISLEDSRIQSGNLTGFISGLFTNDFDLIKRSLNDVIAEPSRAVLIPEFYQVRKMILELGALGSGISGSGPTIFIFSPNEDIATKTKETCVSIYQSIGLEIDSHISSINTQGSQIL